MKTDIILMIRTPAAGIPIKEKKVKGHIYLYQVIRSWRDKETGKVRKIERYLGAKKVSRPKPMMSKLSTADRERVFSAWQDDEDLDDVIAIVWECTGYSPSQATIYNFMRENGISRTEEKRTEPDVMAERLSRQAEIRRK